jgi:uncharacterized protein (DUF2141 family)
MRGIFVALAVIVALVLGAMPPARSQANGKITIEVAGLRTDDGVVRCGLYNSPDGFLATSTPSEQPSC